VSRFKHLRNTEHGRIWVRFSSPAPKTLLTQLALLASLLKIDPQNARFWTQLDANQGVKKRLGRGFFRLGLVRFHAL